LLFTDILDDLCGNDTTKQSIKRSNKLHWAIEHMVKQFQTYFVPGKNIATDESTVGFKGKIIFKIYNAKTTEVGTLDNLY
jgi:hypothetical protein